MKFTWQILDVLMGCVDNLRELFSIDHFLEYPHFNLGIEQRQYPQYGGRGVSFLEKAVLVLANYYSTYDIDTPRAVSKMSFQK